MEWRFDSQPKRMFFALESISRQQPNQLLLSMSFSMFFNGFYCSMYFLIKPHCFKSPYLVQKDKKWLIFTILHLCGHFSCLAYKKANVFCRRFFRLRWDVATAKLLSSSLWAMLETTTTSSRAVLKKSLIYTLHPRIQLGIQLEGIVVQKE